MESASARPVAFVKPQMKYVTKPPIAVVTAASQQMPGFPRAAQSFWRHLEAAILRAIDAKPIAIAAPGTARLSQEEDVVVLFLDVDRGVNLAIRALIVARVYVNLIKV